MTGAGSGSLRRTHRAGPPAESLRLVIDGNEIPVTVHRRAVRLLRLRVMPDGTLTVTCPRHSDVEGFLREKERWIRRKREEVLRLAASPEGSMHRILLDGEFCALRHGSSCRTAGGIVCYTTPAALRRWLVGRLRSDLKERVAAQAARIGVRAPPLIIRRQRSRWASCSSRAGLSFNLRMAALSPMLRDYLVVHELVHLLEANHSTRYWDRVRDFWPQVDESEGELARFWILIERNEIWKVILAG
ncbi:MAG: M48 family metallopeptidase [Methanomicrobiales archaeon]|nr:M48 family metallopeptidase [Methanomicrobiales archaeon]